MTEPAQAKLSIWNGTYQSWEDAVASAEAADSDALDAFDTTRWLERQQEMLDKARSGISPRHTSLQILLAATNLFDVVDLGGGSGWTYEIVSNGCHTNTVSYLVIEQPSTVNYFADEDYFGKKIRFLSSEANLDDELGPAGILYSNSTRQYFPDNSFLTSVIGACIPEWIMLDDIQVALGRTFYSTQHYYGKEIPCRFIQPKSLIDEIVDFGYSLMASWDYPATFSSHMDPVLTVQQNSDSGIGTPMSLLFQKKQSSESAGSQAVGDKD